MICPACNEEQLHRVPVKGGGTEYFCSACKKTFKSMAEIIQARRDNRSDDARTLREKMRETKKKIEKWKDVLAKGQDITSGMHGIAESLDNIGQIVQEKGDDEVYPEIGKQIGTIGAQVKEMAQGMGDIWKRLTKKEEEAEG